MLISNLWTYFFFVLLVVNLANQTEVVVTNGDFLQQILSKFDHLDSRLSDMEFRLNLMDNVLVDITSDQPAVTGRQENIIDDLSLLKSFHNETKEDLNVLKEVASDMVSLQNESNLSQDIQSLTVIQNTTLENLAIMKEEVNVVKQMQNTTNKELDILQKTLTEGLQILKAMQSDTLGSTQACKAKNSCILLRGSCVTNATECRGRLEPDGCSGATCQCCIDECPDGFFAPTGSKLQCFKLLNTQVSWSSARSKCHSQGLKLAKPFNAIVTRNYIMDNFGDGENNITRGTVVSPNYPSNYNNSLDLKWTITTEENATITLDFEAFNTETKYDYLIIRDGNDSSAAQLVRLMGNLAVSSIGAVTSTTNSLHFYFHTDGNTARSGYKFKWSASSVLGDEIWVDGKADGTKVVWQGDGEQLESTSSLWFPGHPGNLVSSTYCLSLESINNAWKSYPDQPYSMQPCNHAEFPLCELIMD